MKFASTFVALALITAMPTVQAQAQSNQLQAALKQFEVTAVVEGDRSKAAQDLIDQLASLEKQGLSKDQILTELKSLVLDPQSAKDIESLIQYSKKHNLSGERLSKFVVDYANKTQKVGANWSDGATYVVLGVVLIAIIIAAANADTFGVVYYDDYYYDCYYDWWGDYVCY